MAKCPDCGNTMHIVDRDGRTNIYKCDDCNGLLYKDPSGEWSAYEPIYWRDWEDIQMSNGYDDD